MSKLCFVAMGFGKKMDYENAKEVDLDKVYKEVIKPMFEEDFPNYEIIRADEIAGSALIDIEMYKLLLSADLVIADITTLNPNAIYELGVRHAVKPFSTILMAQESCNIPFDLGHSRFLKYDDIGEKLDVNEVKKIKNQLKEFVNVCESEEVDSPLYSFLPKLSPPVISSEDFSGVFEKIKGESETISNLMEQARTCMGNDNFEDAIIFWDKLKNALPNNDYVIQQLSLATYKNKMPNETLALENALNIIKELNIDNSLDIETLGISGAIYKRLYTINNNFDYLDEAIKFYQKGYLIKKDYYNGENYANCLMMKTRNDSLSREHKNHLIYSSKLVYKDIVDIILKEIKKGEINAWMYATLSASNLVLENDAEHKENHELFISQDIADWEQNTYDKNIEMLKSVLEAINGGTCKNGS